MLKRLKALRAMLPSRLPSGFTQLEKWLDEVLELAGLPLDNLSLRNSLCTMLLQVDAQTMYVTKHHFVRTVQKAIVNQYAFELSQEIRRQQKELAANEQSLQNQAVQGPSEQVVS